nr:unnamed protein product [Spirometra erinaceieuropaei]
MQDAWVTQKSDKLQEYVDLNETKNVFLSIKMAYCSLTKGTGQLLPSDETSLLTEGPQIPKRQASTSEAFSTVTERIPPSGNESTPGPPAFSPGNNQRRARNLIF